MPISSQFQYVAEFYDSYGLVPLGETKRRMESVTEIDLLKRFIDTGRTSLRVRLSGDILQVGRLSSTSSLFHMTPTEIVACRTLGLRLKKLLLGLAKREGKLLRFVDSPLPSPTGQLVTYYAFEGAQDMNDSEIFSAVMDSTLPSDILDHEPGCPDPDCEIC